MKGHVRLPETITACLFDLDGVLTRTAELHAEAWKQTFDAFLNARSDVFAPFDAVADYDAYVKGKPRDDGIGSFLASRGIVLPEGSNELVHELMKERGVAAYESSLRFLTAVRDAGLSRAVVTSSENAAAVLHAAVLDGAFDVRVDGAVAHDLDAGKPAPDVFLQAARRLRVQPSQAAVFEDALAAGADLIRTP